jgi:hypothetical protein
VAGQSLLMIFVISARAFFSTMDATRAVILPSLSL